MLKRRLCRQRLRAQHQNRLFVVVELTETRTARVCGRGLRLPDRRRLPRAARDRNRIVGSIGRKSKRRNAIARFSSRRTHSSVGGYHRGLWHMYRFNGPTTTRRSIFSASPLQMDPTFRARLRRLRSTHFQNAFPAPAGTTRHIDQRWRQPAELMVDDRDPAAPLPGRAVSPDRQDESFQELERSVT